MNRIEKRAILLTAVGCLTLAVCSAETFRRGAEMIVLALTPEAAR